MPQQLQPAEEAAPLYTSPPAPQTVPQDEATPRYDAQTVRRVIALAEQMQTRHRETLSTEEVENLGREVGVEPEFVRRALAQIDSPQNITSISDLGRQKPVVEVSLGSLTRRQRALAMVPPALYALMMPLTFAWFHNSDNRAVLFYLILPSFLAFCVGVKGKSKRVGTLNGILFALASILSLVGNAAYDHDSQPTFAEFGMILAIWLATGITLGVGGAALRQFVSGPRKRRKRLRVRLIVESDADEEKETNGEWV